MNWEALEKKQQVSNLIRNRRSQEGARKLKAINKKMQRPKKKGKFKLQKKSTTGRGANPRSRNQGCGK